MKNLVAELHYIERNFRLNEPLRKQLHMIVDHAEDEKAQIKHLQIEVRRLRKKIREYELEYGIHHVVSNYVEARGAVFVQDVDGQYRHTPYCPNCRSLMTAFKGGGPYCCDSCFWIADFCEDDLDHIIEGLPEE